MACFAKTASADLEGRRGFPCYTNDEGGPCHQIRTHPGGNAPPRHDDLDGHRLHEIQIRIEPWVVRNVAHDFGVKVGPRAPEGWMGTSGEALEDPERGLSPAPKRPLPPKGHPKRALAAQPPKKGRSRLEPEFTGADLVKH